MRILWLLLRLLLWLLPKGFRREYGDELLLTVRDLWREKAPTLTFWRRIGFWLRQGWAVVAAAWRLRRGRGILGGTDRRRFQSAVRAQGAAMSGIGKDLRYAARALMARPGLTLAAVLTLGLGVGATTAMFSAVEVVMLRPLPYPQADQLLVIKQADARDGALAEGVSAANMRDVARMSETLDSAALANANGFTWLEDGRAISLRGWVVSTGFFEAIGIEARLGRTFLAEEYVAGREAVVVLSHQAWSRRFGADPSIIDRELILDDRSHTVIGVLPPGFAYPAEAELWAPRPPQPWDDDYRSAAGMEVIARLAVGHTLAQAQAELGQIAEHLTATFPEANAHLDLRAIPLRHHLFGDLRLPLLVLLGAVALVLLIAVANVAGLQLARGVARAREYALRAALGASSSRLLRLVTCESLLLAAAGGLVGIGLAAFGIELIRRFGPRQLPSIDAIGLHGPVLVFALVTALSSALLAGWAPALRASRLDPQLALGEATRGSTGGRRSNRLRDRLVVVEIAVALVLLISAGLLVRSFERLLDNELGFEPEGRLAVQVFAYDDEHQPAVGFFRRGVEELLALPGVTGVGLTTALPAADDLSIWSGAGETRFTIDGRQATEPGEMLSAGLSAIDDGFASAIGIGLHSGRFFEVFDHAEAAPVALVNESFARHHFPNIDAIGQRLTLRRDEISRMIVGVLADTRPRGFESTPREEIYLPLLQAPSGSLTFVIATDVDPAALITPAQEALWSVDPTQAIWAARPMTELLVDHNRQRRFNTALLACFAGLALTLAAIGIYALMSFSVEQRSNELGIRRALGGQRHDILGAILRRGLSLALTGVGLGLLASWALTRLLRGMLFGVQPFDAFTFGTLSVWVVFIVLLATALPALRATRVDPIEALRAD